MTRLIRMLVPVWLCGLFSGGIIVACRHQEAPATPKPDLVNPAGSPTHETGQGAGVTEPTGDAGADAQTPPPTPGGGGLSALAPSGADGTVVPAAQPTAPAGSQPSSPSSGQPLQPGTPPSPGTTPVQPGGSAGSGRAPVGTVPPRPGTPTQGSGAPPAGSSSQPTDDAGVDDGSIPLPPASDGGLPADGGMQPSMRH